METLFQALDELEDLVEILLQRSILYFGPRARAGEAAPEKP
jgi:hypothetical protein